MPNYDILEYLTPTVAKVEYPGIGATGFRDIAEDKVVNPTFRSTGILEDTYDPKQKSDPEVDWGIEVWIITDSPTVTETEVAGKLHDVSAMAHVQMPFIKGDRDTMRISTNEPLIPPEEPHPWKAVVRAKGKRYVVDFEENRVDW